MLTPPLKASRKQHYRNIFRIILFSITIITISCETYYMQPPIYFYRSILNRIKERYNSQYVSNFIDALQTELFPMDYTKIHRIVGGKEADIRSFPFHISLSWPGNDGYNCGGILITSKHVLTAAHCVIMKSGWHMTPENILLITGRNYLNETGEVRLTKTITPHPEYVITTKQNDIAVIEAIKPFTLTDKVNTIPIIHHRVLPLTLCTTVGFGAASSEGPGTTNHLMHVNVPIHSMLRCRLSYFKRVKIYEGMMCAGYFTGARDACTGDSGGPLICEDKLAGIVSAGIGCGIFYNPGIYTDVYHYRTFIKSVIDEITPIPSLTTSASITAATTEKSSSNTTDKKMLRFLIKSGQFLPIESHYEPNNISDYDEKKLNTIKN